MISNAGQSGELYCPTCEQQFAVGDRCPDDGTKLVRLATTVDPFLGRELEGRYTIVEKLGQGGMGTVYRGHQHSVGRDVAIKVVNPTLVSSPEVIKRFLRECKLASRLAHPNAVGVLDFGQTDDGVFFLVMELVAGRTLSDVMDSERTLRPERVIRIGVQICEALEGAHGMNVIHRDLKPANVMLLSTGRDLVKVLDFGLAKSLSPDSAQSTMTGDGALMGTPAYMPPELASGQECDGRADLYSLGCMLYYLGSGRLPFASDSVHELVMMQASEPAPPMAGVPPSLAAVIDRLLLKDPDDRYQTAVATREALEHALERLRDSKPAPAQPHRDDTAISLGPFPATASQFDFLDGAPGPDDASRAGDAAASARRRTRSTAESRLGVLDTFAVANHASLGAARRRRRWALAIGGVFAIGVVVVLAVGRRHPAPGGDAPTGRAPLGSAVGSSAIPTIATPVGSGSGAPAAQLDAGVGLGVDLPGVVDVAIDPALTTGKRPGTRPIGTRPTGTATTTTPTRDPHGATSGPGSAAGAGSGSGSGARHVPGSPDQETPPF